MIIYKYLLYNYTSERKIRQGLKKRRQGVEEIK